MNCISVIFYNVKHNLQAAMTTNLAKAMRSDCMGLCYYLMAQTQVQSLRHPRMNGEHSETVEDKFIKGQLESL